jgi:hypothetical protein
VLKGNKYDFITLQIITIKKFHSPEFVTNFVFLQYSGPWYYLLHKSNDFENGVECPFGLFASPVGNRSSVTTNVYDSRWFYNVNFLTALFMVKPR